jgi:BirA family biotin operon repressor/biotin-[acetyl-CoA-carboxylase] ligase
MPDHQKPLVSFLVAVALAETLESYIAPDLISLKWPNDVLVGGAKIAGILLEAGEGWLTIGVGVNLEHHPEGTPYPVTHLLEHIATNRLDTAEPIYAGPDPILAQLAQKIETGIHTLQTESFAPIREKWLSRAARQGEVVKVNLGKETVEGVFETLSENGALQLRLPNGTLRDIVAGDVLL